MACGVASESGEAPEPVVVPALATTESGSGAISVAEIDPATCNGVLAPVTGRFSLETQSLTDTVKESQPQILSMCSAIYETVEVGGEFLTIALIEFDSGSSATSHYEMIKNVFIENDWPTRDGCAVMVQRVDPRRS